METLSLALLGPMQITRNGQPVTGFESNKVRGLLSFLALESDRPHRREALAGLLWPEQGEQSARNNLRQALANLRAALNDRAAQPPLLVISRETVQWNPAGDYSLDVDHVRSAVEACKAHAHRDLQRCAICARRLERAVALYRGPLLHQFFLADSVAFEEWALIKREALHRLTIDALMQLTAYHQRRGAFDASVQYAARQLELDPWREDAHRHLMLALFHGGQRSAALAQYEACRRVLAEELGVEPEDETARLYEQIKAAEPGDTAARPARDASHNLPPQPTPLIGREEELTELAELVANPACRLISIVGPGGIGKTRVAIELAQQQATAFADGVCFVSLASISDPDFLVPAIAQALKLTLAGQDEPRAQLLAHVRGRELLLVLDNFEHLIAGADLLAELLQATTDLKLLVTSRERLELRWEWVFDIEGLRYPPDRASVAPDEYSAVRLFVQRARQMRRHFALTQDEAVAVARICRLVEGMPLAIELAAASSREQSCTAIAQEIASNLDALATSLRDVPARHRSVRAAFDHSWQLLNAEEQRVLRQLAVFRGGCHDAAAAAVVGAAAEVVSALINKSLLRGEIRTPQPRRVEMHELVRQYAMQQLALAGETECVGDRHLAYFQEIAEAAEPHLIGAEQGPWLERLDAEHDNLRAALQWALQQPEADAALRLAGALSRYWRIHGHLSEGRRWLDQALGHAGYHAAPPLGRLKALNGAGGLARLQGDLLASARWLDDCLSLSRAIGDARWIAIALNGLGLVARRQGDPMRAVTLYEESLAFSRQAEDRLGIVNALSNLAGVLNSQGEHARAAQLYEESLAFSREAGDQLGIAADLNNLGNAVFDMGDFERARALYEESLALYTAGGDQYGASLALFNLGDLAHRMGDLQRARGHLRQGLALSHTLANQLGCVEYLEKLAWLAVDERDAGHAVRLWAASAAAREMLAAALSPDQREERERQIHTGREQLDAVAWDAAWAEGRAMSLERAVAYALEPKPVTSAGP